MANDEQELREKLEQLHDAVHGAREVDPAERALLEEILRDVRGLLERSGGPAADEASLTDRLREAVDRFEVSHPALAAAAGRVVDALASLGI